MSDDFRLSKPCPLCKQQKTLVVSGYRVTCENHECDFDVTIACPLCDASLDAATRRSSDSGDIFTCGSCSKDISVKRLHYLLENSLIVDRDQRCKLCNGPTIHRSEMNMGHRCFFFPRCSGQAGLFGEVQQSLIFLDFETTGLEIGKDAIIEVGALKIDHEGYEHGFQSFVKPPGSIDPRITKITGIDNDMVADAPGLEAVMKDLIAFIGNGTIVAHNVEFDIPWLLTSAMRYDLPLSGNTVVCTLKWSKRVKEPRSSLGALSKKYKIGHANAHRALADAAVTKDLYLIYEDQHPEFKQNERIEDYKEFCERIVEKFSAYVQA